VRGRKIKHVPSGSCLVSAADPARKWAEYAPAERSVGLSLDMEGRGRRRGSRQDAEGGKDGCNARDREVQLDDARGKEERSGRKLFCVPERSQPRLTCATCHHCDSWTSMQSLRLYKRIGRGRPLHLVTRVLSSDVADACEGALLETAGPIMRTFHRTPHTNTSLAERTGS
jgi:hypothetical protein